MRFIQSINNLGDKKIVKKFLWWPLKIENETRWLEYVTVEYTYTCWGTYDDNKMINRHFDWSATKFIDV